MPLLSNPARAAKRLIKPCHARPHDEGAASQCGVSKREATARPLEPRAQQCSAATPEPDSIRHESRASETFEITGVPILESPGPIVFGHACRMDLQGIMPKRKTLGYRRPIGGLARQQLNCLTIVDKSHQGRARH
jgi:hypothetical protein